MLLWPSIPWSQRSHLKMSTGQQPTKKAQGKWQTIWIKGRTDGKSSCGMAATLKIKCPSFPCPLHSTASVKGSGGSSPRTSIVPARQICTSGFICCRLENISFQIILTLIFPSLYSLPVPLSDNKCKPPFCALQGWSSVPSASSLNMTGNLQDWETTFLRGRWIQLP